MSYNGDNDNCINGFFLFFIFFKFAMFLNIIHKNI